MIGESEEARTYFTLMKEQAERDGNEAYRMAAEIGLQRLG